MFFFFADFNGWIFQREEQVFELQTTRYELNDKWNYPIRNSNTRERISSTFSKKYKTASIGICFYFFPLPPPSPFNSLPPSLFLGIDLHGIWISLNWRLRGLRFRRRRRLEEEEGGVIVNCDIASDILPPAPIEMKQSERKRKSKPRHFASA